MWLGIPKPMIPYPLLWEGAVQIVASHLGCIPNCSEVPDTPIPPPSPVPPPQGASGQPLVGGGVVGVQIPWFAPPPQGLGIPENARVT